MSNFEALPAGDGRRVVSVDGVALKADCYLVRQLTGGEGDVDCVDGALCSWVVEPTQEGHMVPLLLEFLPDVVQGERSVHSFNDATGGTGMVRHVGREGDPGQGVEGGDGDGCLQSIEPAKGRPGGKEPEAGDGLVVGGEGGFQLPDGQGAVEPLAGRWLEDNRKVRDAFFPESVEMVRNRNLCP